MAAFSATKKTVGEVDVVELAGGEYVACVATQLGELCSLSYRGKELIWRALDFTAAPPGGWWGHAQTLWPAVGRHAEGLWTWDGVARAMPLHGLVMSGPFECLRACAGGGSASTCLVVRSVDLPPAARAAYPFDATLRVTWTLTARGLAVRHEVSAAAGGGAVPFAIGNHLSLRVAGGAGGWAAARLASAHVTHELALGPGSLLTGARDPRPEFAQRGGAPLSARSVTDGVFACHGARADAPVCLALRLPAARCAVAVSHELEPPEVSGAGAAACDWARVADARLFVLWGQERGDGSAAAARPAGDGFLCVEPWLTGPDSLNARDGSTPVLRAGETAAWTFTVEVTDDSGDA